MKPDEQRPMTKLSTDREILQCIYDMYAPEFGVNQENPDDKNGNRIYIPIDVRVVAKRLGDDPHVLFGRLYYHLAHKYSYKNDDDSKVQLFALKIGQNRHCVHYPYLAAILSEHLEQHHENARSFKISIAAFIVSVFAVIVSIVYG